jgi:hypothetical protein
MRKSSAQPMIAAAQLPMFSARAAVSPAWRRPSNGSGYTLGLHHESIVQFC